MNRWASSWCSGGVLKTTICERKAPTTPAPTTTPAPINWITDPDSGNQYVDLEVLIYDNVEDAKDRCEAVGGMLPEPRNREENDFLNSMTTEPFYLGMTDKAKEGSWVWNSDGSSVQWTFWRSGEPDGGSDQNCVFMLKSADKNNMNRWASSWCSGGVLKTTICERKAPTTPAPTTPAPTTPAPTTPATTTPATTQPVPATTPEPVTLPDPTCDDSDCPGDFCLVGGRCLYRHKPTLRYEEAVALCASMDAKMMIPQTEEFFNILMQWEFVTVKQPHALFWMGATNMDSSDPSVYYWEDGQHTPLDTSAWWYRWVSDRPWTSPDRCAAASRELMAFKDFKCDKKKAFPICEVPNPGSP